MSDEKKVTISVFFFLRHAGFTLLDLSYFPLKMTNFTENLSIFPFLFFFPPTPAGQEFSFPSDVEEKPVSKYKSNLQIANAQKDIYKVATLSYMIGKCSMCWHYSFQRTKKSLRFFKMFNKNFTYYCKGSLPPGHI